MFWRKRNDIKERKENEERLRKLHGREVRYASKRDFITNVEYVIGKNGVIAIENDVFLLKFNEKTIFESPIKQLWGSELMSLDGIILTKDKIVSDPSEKEVMVYYKYYRKVD